MVCYSDQVLVIFGFFVIDIQCGVLLVICYQLNWVVLYIDCVLLLCDEKLWFVWNYLVGNGELGEQLVVVFYLINWLQLLFFKIFVIVMLNLVCELDLVKVIVEFDYVYLIFDGLVIVVQQCLVCVQGENGIWLVGVWGSYGFYEDGLKLVLWVCNGLGVWVLW